MGQKKNFDKAFKEQIVAKILSSEITSSLMARKLGVLLGALRNQDNYILRRLEMRGIV